MQYDIVLKRKPYIQGLRKEEILTLLNMFKNEVEVFPIEIDAGDLECSAIGFITKEAASRLDYDYKNSGLRDFVVMLLDNEEIGTNGKIVTFKNNNIFIIE